MWDASRIDGLLDQLEEVGPAATAAARLLPGAVVEHTTERLEEVLEDCAEHARAVRVGEKRALAQVRGVIEETRGRRAAARAAIDEHFANAQLGLIDALGETDLKAYRKHVKEVLAG